MGRKLVKPSFSYAAQLCEMRERLLKENSRFPGCGHLERYSDISEWLCEIEKEENARQEEIFLYVSGDRLLGMIEIRKTLNAYLYNYGGQIGYTVHPEERRKGYGSEMLGKILPCCRALGFKEVLVTCVDFNTASEKIIRKNGGVYQDTRDFKEGGVSLKRFLIDTGEEKKSL